jgi:hypothetical protein
LRSGFQLVLGLSLYQLRGRHYRLSRPAKSNSGALKCPTVETLEPAAIG